MSTGCGFATSTSSTESVRAKRLSRPGSGSRPQPAPQRKAAGSARSGRPDLGRTGRNAARTGVPAYAFSECLASRERTFLRHRQMGYQTPMTTPATASAMTTTHTWPRTRAPAIAASSPSKYQGLPSKNRSRSATKTKVTVRGHLDAERPRCGRSGCRDVKRLRRGLPSSCASDAASGCCPPRQERIPQGRGLVQPTR